MDLTPSQVTGATFRTVRKGYDPDEVEAFLAEAARAIESAQQQATAMEARARAAVSRLQEVSAQQQSGAAAEPDSAPLERVDVAAEETISRTLLLAQRTADTTIAEARAEAERIRADAQREAETTLDSTREMSARLIDEARVEARKLTETERREAENEVEELKARRDFLVGDVDQLEQFLVDQRERLRGAARQIEALCERVPSGLGEVRRPALSAADEEPADETSSDEEPADETSSDEEPADEMSSDDEPADETPAGAADGDDEETVAIDMSDHLGRGSLNDATEAEFRQLAELAAQFDEANRNAPRDDTAELVVPPEARADYATIDELANAIGDDEGLTLGEGLADADDPGPNVSSSEAPELPRRNPSSD